MKKTTIKLPTMYGDHHVIEVRRLLFEMAGVQDVSASSAFQEVEVSYDPGKVNDLEIACKLDEAGYLGEWSLPIELSASASKDGGQGYFRHSAVYETTHQVVSFARKVEETARPLWNCPGMGVIKGMEE